MGQDFAPLHRSIWSDADFRALSVDAQHLYLLLLSHPDRNSAGVLTLNPKKWTRLASDLSRDRLFVALDELDGARFVVVDDETDEVLVRSFIRHAGVYKHIRMMANALRDVAEAESARVRWALGQELSRLPRLAIPENAKMRAEAEAAQQRLDELAVAPSPPNGPGQGDVHPMAHGMADPMAHPLAHPPVVVAGAVAGAGAVAAPAPKPAESQGVSHVSSGSPSRPPLYSDRCKAHGDVAEPPPCGMCADARKRNKQIADAFPDYRLRVVPDLCGQCDERWIETPDGLAKCPRCYPQERSA